jgi:hypothetical protein
MNVHWKRTLQMMMMIMMMMINDETEDDVSLHWRNYNFSRCTINTGENVPWEYMENEVCVGAMYPSTAHLKDAVK